MDDSKIKKKNEKWLQENLGYFLFLNNIKSKKCKGKERETVKINLLWRNKENNFEKNNKKGQKQVKIKEEKTSKYGWRHKTDKDEYLGKKLGSM